MPEAGLEEDYKKLLSAAAKSQHSLLHDFRIRFFAEEDSVFAFFEGEDDRLYFMPAIRERFGSEIHFFECGGKPKVLSLRNAVLSIANKSSRCMFFIDRDHDDYIEMQADVDEFTYITDFYSIESDLISRYSVEIILSDIAGVARNGPEFCDILEQFEKNREFFVNSIRPIKIWTICSRRNGAKVNLNNVDLSKMYNRDRSGLLRKSDKSLEYFMKQSSQENIVNDRDLYRRMRRVLNNIDCRCWIRGKYYLWFFSSEILYHLKMVSKYNNEKSNTQSKKIKIPQFLAQNYIFETLGARIPKPTSLNEFLNSRHKNLFG